MDVTSWGSAEWAAFGAIGAVLVYIVLGVIALRQLGESRRLRELEHRPYVLVDFYFKGLQVMLEVRNAGRTPARDVEVTFDKPLQASSSHRAADFTIFKSPIPMIAPERVIRLSLGTGPDFFKEGAEVPLSYTAQVKYTDMTGKQKYSDPPLLLDLEPYKNTIPPRDNAGDLVSAVRDLRKTLAGWSSPEGLKVSAIDRHAHERSVQRWYRRSEARQQLRQGGVALVARSEWQRLRRRFS
jgi:hypothetical protein